MIAFSTYIRVGIIIPLKKIQNKHIQKLLQSKANDIHFIHIDLNTIYNVDDIDIKYGHFDIILHKLTYDMIYDIYKDPVAIKNMTIVNKYILKYPKMHIIDPLKSIYVLINREKMYNMLSILSKKSEFFSIPKYIIVNSYIDMQLVISYILEKTISLPVIIKPIDAESHTMKIITHIDDIQLFEYINPIIFQEYINHDKQLYKAYVLNNEIFIFKRISLPNIIQNKYNPPIEFNTQSLPLSINTDEIINPQIQKIGHIIQDKIKLSIFGFDVIINSKNNTYLVIDVNYFPSFKELNDFDMKMRLYIKSIMQ
jgi:inositol 1,3,4-trisphosphate 5/6-kinase